MYFLQACAGFKELDVASVTVVKSFLDPIYVVSLDNFPKPNER